MTDSDLATAETSITPLRVTMLTTGLISDVQMTTLKERSLGGSKYLAIWLGSPRYLCLWEEQDRMTFYYSRLYQPLTYLSLLEVLETFHNVDEMKCGGG